MLRYLSQSKRIKDPGMRIRSISSIPESILQMLGVAHCQIEFSCAPSSFPDLDYKRFFDGRNEFRLPEGQKKMDLTDLLVVVPTILANRWPIDLPVQKICNPDYVMPLHQTIVARIRNPAAHTYADLTEKDAMLITDTCFSWLDTAAVLAGYASGEAFLASIRVPDVDQISSFLFNSEYSVSNAFGDGSTVA